MPAPLPSIIFFTYPYNYFTLNIVGYPIDFVCFTMVTLLVSVLTYQLRGETEKAIRHEQETVELYERNRKLEEKRAEAEMEAAKEKMHGNLLRAVSHDLRTPLTAVAGSSSVLMNDARLTPRNGGTWRRISTRRRYGYLRWWKTFFP